MALIRKAAAGSDSFGHVWAEDGAVVEINDADQIAALMDIPDAGFSEVISQRKPTQAPADDGGGQADSDEITEVDPQAEDIEADKPAAKKTAARKTTASKPE